MRLLVLLGLAVWAAGLLGGAALLLDGVRRLMTGGRDSTAKSESPANVARISQNRLDSSSSRRIA
jgi:hypothetical protein